VVDSAYSNWDETHSKSQADDRLKTDSAYAAWEKKQDVLDQIRKTGAKKITIIHKNGSKTLGILLI
jgi:hypothetical protein